MGKKIQREYEIVAILNEALVYVFMAFVFELLWKLPFLKSFSSFEYIIFVPIKVFLYSGIYGALVEIVSGQEINLKLTRIIFNARQYWKQYFLVSLGILIFFKVLMLNLAQKQFLYFDRIADNSGIITIFIMGWYISRSKYKDAMIIDGKSNLKVYHVVVLTFICFFSVYLSHFQLIFRDAHSWHNRALLFLLKYFHFMIFIYWIHIVQERFPLIRESFEFKKEIFFVNPVDGGIYRPILYQFHNPALAAFTVLKALTPFYYNVRVFNKAQWRDRYYKKNKLIAISCVTSNCYEAYRIAKEFKKKGSTVIMGGHHVSHMPDEALEYCDSVVTGYAEDLWTDVIKDYENNTLKKIYFKEPQEIFSKDMQERILTFSDKEVRDSLELTRGCKNKCDFCSIHAFGNIGLKKVSIEFLIERIRKIKHRYKKLIFHDSNIYSDPQYAKKFFEALKPLDIKWVSFSTIDIAKDEEAVKLAKESGCMALGFGFETSTGSEEMKKGGKYEYGDSYVEFARKIKKAGILIRASFIFGFDSDTFFGLFKLLRFCMQIWPNITVVGLLIPMPGSEIYRQMVKEDRLTDLNWKSYNGTKPVFNTLKVNKKTIQAIYSIFKIILHYTSRIGICFFVLTIAIIFMLIRLKFYKSGNIF